MKWVRSCYKDIETSLASGRSFVWDGKGMVDQVFWQEGGDYYDLFAQADDDLIIIEWDIAIDREDKQRFVDHCDAEPDRVHVAPYKHYYFKIPGTEWSYLHRRDLDNPSHEGDQSCMLFGFGLTYIPLELIQLFMEDLDSGEPFYYQIPYELRSQPGVYRQYDGVINQQIVNDTVFAAWHWQTVRRPVPIHWDVRPIHLNYEDTELERQQKPGMRYDLTPVYES